MWYIKPTCAWLESGRDGEYYPGKNNTQRTKDSKYIYLFRWEMDREIQSADKNEDI